MNQRWDCGGEDRVIHFEGCDCGCNEFVWAGCGEVGCETCWNHRRLKTRNTVLNSLNHESRGKTGFMLTLSVRSRSNLIDALLDLNTAWKKFRDRAAQDKRRRRGHPWRRVFRYVGVMEIKRHVCRKEGRVSKKGKWIPPCKRRCALIGHYHPHFHLILTLVQAVDRISYSSLRKMWNEAAGYAVQSDLQPLGRMLKTNKAVGYITKYISKGSFFGNLSHDDTMANRKVLKGFHFIRGYYKLPQKAIKTCSDHGSRWSMCCIGQDFGICEHAPLEILITDFTDD